MYSNWKRSKTMAYDKYQQSFLENINMLRKPNPSGRGVYSYQEQKLIPFGSFSSKKEKGNHEIFFDDYATIAVKQDFDIFSFVYVLKINVNIMKNFKKIESYQNGKWNTVADELIFDFENKCTEIKLHPLNDLTDPIIMNIEYKESDREVYYAKERENREAFMSDFVSISTGIQLINIYWEDAISAKIALFKYVDKHVFKLGVYVFSGKVEESKSKKNLDSCFLSISNVTGGKYGISFEAETTKNEKIETTKQFEVVGSAAQTY